MVSGSVSCCLLNEINPPASNAKPSMYLSFSTDGDNTNVDRFVVLVIFESMIAERDLVPMVLSIRPLLLS